MQSMIQLATAFFKMAESLAKPHTVPQLPRGVVQLRCRRPKTVVRKKRVAFISDLGRVIVDQVGESRWA